MTHTIWHNGEIQAAQTPIFDIGSRLRYGDGIFDTMLAIDGQPIHQELHLKRLLKSAQVMSLDVDTKQIERVFSNIPDLLKQNGKNTSQAVINTYIVRGSSERGLTPKSNTDHDLIVKTSPAPPQLKNITAITSTIRRNEGSPLSNIKSMNYGDNILAKIEAETKDADEALMLNNAGSVACFTIGNVLISKGNKLYTPPLSDGAVAGIIRGILIDYYNVQEKSLRPEDILNADGVYLTNSVRGIAPISMLDKQKFSPHALPFGNELHLKDV